MTGWNGGSLMLPPDARTVLTDVLRPPPGTTLDRALALTYSLDLESALVVPLAFAGQVLRESSDPVAVMEAVRGCADRVDVFCQAGQVTVPQRGSDLLAFLEPVVHLVGRPRPGRLFHPKLWALRFRDETTGDVHARVLILSRNLTADRSSWDVCLRLDGLVGSDRKPTNEPLATLINATLDLAVTPVDARRRRAITELVDDLRKTDWTHPEGVREIAFHVLGVPGGTRPDFTGSRHLAVAPFCNAEGLAVTMPGGGGTVISCQEDLDRLPGGTLDGRTVFVINELAGLPTGEDSQDQSIFTGLHAKLYIIEFGHHARVLLGSANATDAAFGGNVEILAELTGSKARLGIDALLSAERGFGAILEPYDRGAPEEENEDDRALLNLLRDLAAVPLVGEITPDDGVLSLRLTSEAPLPAGDSSVRVTAELVTRRGEAVTLRPGSPANATFTGLAVVDVTPFVVLTARDHRDEALSTVVCATLVGDPAGRFDEVIARQVDTPEKFLRFLALLLGLAGDTSSLFGDGQGGSGTWGMAGGQGVLELLMRALVDRPEQLDDLARLVARLQSTEQGRTVLPPGFTELWQIVDGVRRDLAEVRQ
jgi:hypothetical protein